MDSDSIQSCCRLCFSTKDDCTINIFSNNPTGLNVATTIEKYFAFRVNIQEKHFTKRNLQKILTENLN